MMTPPEGWTRCHHFSIPKNRYCRQVLNPNSPYCGNHRHLYVQQNDLQESLRTHQNQGDEDECIHSKKKNHPRIPCPVDPSHHIYANKLEQHLAKCPKNVFLQNLKRQDFYHENCNTGGYGEKYDGSTSKRARRWMTPETGEDELSSSKTTSDNQQETDISFLHLREAHRLAIYSIELFQQLFMHDKNVNGVAKSIDNQSERLKSVQQLTLDEILHYSKIELMDLNNPTLEAQVQEPIQYHRIKVGGEKHSKQILSIIGHAQQHWRSDSSNSTCTILELGAGRAMTGFVTACHFVNQMPPNTESKVQLIVIDKSGSRAKADTAIRRIENNEDQVSDEKKSTEDSLPNHAKAISMNRVKCDLAHVHIPTVLRSLIDEKTTIDTFKSFTTNVSKRNIIAVAKHLCGAGSDLALKSLLPIGSHIHSCYLAPCCHGLCNYEDYVGRDYLRDLFLEKNRSLQSDENPFFFGEDEFLLLRRWSSSAVSDTSHNQPSEDMDILELDDTTMAIVRYLGLKCGPQGLGRICQRLIDYGRLQFMKDQLFVDESESDHEVPHTDLCHYVSENITPQNALLKGWWSEFK